MIPIYCVWHPRTSSCCTLRRWLVPSTSTLMPAGVRCGTIHTCTHVWNASSNFCTPSAAQMLLQHMGYMMMYGSVLASGNTLISHVYHTSETITRYLSSMQYIQGFAKGQRTPSWQVFGITRVSRRPELVGLGFFGIAGALVATTATQA